MKRVKQIVQYWCDDVIKGKYLGKGVVAAVLDTGIAPLIRIFKIKCWHFETL